MQPVNVLDARNQLSQLIAAAGNGEDVVIAKRGRPVVRIVAIRDASHASGDAALWLTNNPVPARSARSTAELDAQIAGEREGWE
ncbi:MAG: type toxin-antitoxin system prevent-host-death family antitoxin [Rhodoglobus sp.]|nr:type toxin-antitoxin system prevent-host-death family antitoxin [Rhodoglobus sp.]